MMQVDLEAFIIRSFKIYKQYEEINDKKDDYSVTLLINLLLGILIQPTGKWYFRLQLKLFNDRYPLMNETVKSVIGGKNSIENLQEYLSAIRNALAHRNDCKKERLEFESNDSNEILNLNIDTQIGKDHNIKNIRIEIEVKKLKALLKEIAESYLEFFDEKYKGEMTEILSVWLYSSVKLNNPLILKK